MPELSYIDFCSLQISASLKGFSSAWDKYSTYMLSTGEHSDHVIFHYLKMYFKLIFLLVLTWGNHHHLKTPAFHRSTSVWQVTLGCRTFQAVIGG
jgi:hypothetical protein